MTKLTDIVWPAIEEEVQRIIRKSEARVVVVEAAILTKAGWDAFCHEVTLCLTAIRFSAPFPPGLDYICTRKGSN